MTLIVAVFMLFVMVAVVVYFVQTYNALVAAQLEIDRAWGNIDLILKQRFDEIPKLVSLIETYLQYEQGTIQKLLDARRSYLGAQNVTQKAASNTALNQAMKGLMVVTEGYPELRSNANFVQLQSRVSTLEDALSDRRELYNSTVTIFNTRIRQIPEVFVAGIDRKSVV